MIEADEVRARLLIGELDKLIPRKDAWLRMEESGGSRAECRMVANQQGYLRLGIEFLKGALPQTGSPSAVTIDLSDLITDDSTINFDEFVVQDRPGNELARSTSVGNLIGLILGFGCLALFIMSIVGIVATVNWLSR